MPLDASTAGRLAMNGAEFTTSLCAVSARFSLLIKIKFARVSIMVFPYLLVGAIGYMVYSSRKKDKKKLSN